jgi:hypothetical protein
MNDRRLIAAGLAVGLLLLAYMFRYEPVGGAGLEFVTVWDRWLHRVCVVSLTLDNKLACSFEEMSEISSEQSQATEIRKLREAGFSESEIADHLKKSAEEKAK